MISFKQFITEARMAPLYHGTEVQHLQSILLEKKGILPRTEHTKRDMMLSRWGNVQGISTSRSFHYAAQYRDNQVVLELDQAALMHRYQIRPIQYWQGYDMQTDKRKNDARIKGRIYRRDGGVTRANEFEEFILTDKPLPVKYIKHIYVEERYIQMAGTTAKVIDQIRDMYGRDFIRTYSKEFKPNNGSYYG